MQKAETAGADPAAQHQGLIWTGSLCSGYGTRAVQDSFWAFCALFLPCPTPQCLPLMPSGAEHKTSLQQHEPQLRGSSPKIASLFLRCASELPQGPGMPFKPDIK